MFLFDFERLIAMYNGTLVFVFQTLGIKFVFDPLTRSSYNRMLGYCCTIRLLFFLRLDFVIISYCDIVNIDLFF